MWCLQQRYNYKTAVADCLSCEIVATAAHGNQHVVVAREIDAGNHAL